jgi:hypothetical protein
VALLVPKQAELNRRYEVIIDKLAGNEIQASVSNIIE